MADMHSARRVRRTPEYVQAARTTWRWGCNIVCTLLALNAVILLLMLARLDLAGLGILDFSVFCSLAFGVWRLRPRAGHNIVPRWYVEELMRIGGEEQ